MCCILAILVIQYLFVFLQSKNYSSIFNNSTALLNLIKYDNTNIRCLSLKENSFLIHKNRKCWLDRYTESILRTYVKCKNVYKSQLNNIQDGLKVTSLFDNHPNRYILALGSSKFIIDIKKVFPNLQNPAFILWNNYFIISWRIRRSLIRINYIPIKSILINNNDSISLNRIDILLNNLQNINFHSKNLSHLPFHGEDPRLIIVPTIDTITNKMVDKLFIVYSVRFQRTIPEIWMYYSELYFNEYQQLKHKTKININFKSESNLDQKNWSPFVNNNSLLFVTNINPTHNIAKTISIPSYSHVEGKSIATTYNDKNNLNISKLWQWGELRGGTPAIYIPNNDYYLSFFHSSNKPKRNNDWLQTYVFGAYIFCSKYPYKILKMSSQPIIHHSMYEGPWLHDPISASYIDYVNFPMSFIIENEFIYLSYGSQDKDGYVIKIDYKQLYDSLIDINTQC